MQKKSEGGLWQLFNLNPSFLDSKVTLRKLAKLEYRQCTLYAIYNKLSDFSKIPVVTIVVKIFYKKFSFSHFSGIFCTVPARKDDVKKNYN